MVFVPLTNLIEYNCFREIYLLLNRISYRIKKDRGLKAEKISYNIRDIYSAIKKEQYFENVANYGK